jgi:2-oxo-4-hydroxy-4-carboxy--5-ureidoimidazoline (OHCU) decarboxylase
MRAGCALPALQLALACVDALGSLFAATARPECLDGVAEALEQQCGEAAAAQAAVRALAAACDAALPRLQGGALRQHPALASSLLHLAAACAAYAPAALYASPALGALLQLATAAVALREADPVAAALQLAAKLAAAWACGGDEGVSAAHLEAVRSVLAAQGPALVAALLAAACDTCPRHLLRTAADCLRRLLAHPELGGAAGGWLAAAATSGQLPGAAEGYLSPQDCAAFARLAPGLQGARFLALFSDFGLLARGHNTSDVLLAYEL